MSVDPPPPMPGEAAPKRDLLSGGVSQAGGASQFGGPSQAGEGLWSGVIRRYRQFLPVTDATPIITLNEGNTRLFPQSASPNGRAWRVRSISSWKG